MLRSSAICGDLPNLTLPACKLAPRLLGCRLARRDSDGWRVGVIVETEAYPGGHDRASHTFGARRTERNASMWLRGGHAYVYFVYGMHYCVNIVSGSEGQGEAVLVRALRAVEGLEAMRQARGPTVIDRDLCRGPARLTKALGIDRRHDGVCLLSHPALRLLAPAEPHTATVRSGPRIGVAYAGSWAKKPWRYWMEASESPGSHQKASTPGKGGTISAEVRPRRRLGR